MKTNLPILDNLSAKDAEVILELSPKLEITFAKRLAKGSERKFYVETSRDDKRLLRIGNTAHYDWAEAGARWYEYIASAGINAMHLLDMGVLNDKTLLYQLYTWFDGDDLTEVLPHMSNTEQFFLGMKCGAVARKIHALPPLHETEPWGVRYKRKMHDKLQAANHAASSREGTLLMQYLQDHMSLLDNRPYTTTHGNWNTENIILTPNGQIGVIDHGLDCNDPWFEFWEAPDDANAQAYFYTGQIKGYFGGNPPAEYFPLLTFYMAFGRIEWEYDFQCLLDWTDNMRNPVPIWYLSDYNG